MIDHEREIPWATEKLEEVHTWLKKEFERNEIADLPPVFAFHGPFYDPKEALPFEPAYRQNLIHEMEEKFLPDLKRRNSEKYEPILQYLKEPEPVFVQGPVQSEWHVIRKGSNREPR